ncbi:MAG: hypothetical protein JWL92_86 [Candidatus Nomurabacteria bacterium]|nr:hypothetical protein [Candidatus Nomurabacteria bacterium]
MSNLPLRSKTKESESYAAQSQSVPVGHIRGKKQKVVKVYRGRQTGAYKH